MKTLTVTKARQNLGGWLKRAIAGEEIGVVFGHQVVALRPVPIMAADYMEQEYGLTKEEADRGVERLRAETARDRAAGRLIPIEKLAADVAARRKTKGLRRARRAA